MGLVLAIGQIVGYPGDVASPELWVRVAATAFVALGSAVEFGRVRKGREMPVLQPREPVEITQIVPRRIAAKKELVEPAPVEAIATEVPRSMALDTAALADKLKPFSGVTFDGSLAARGGEYADLWWGLKIALVTASWKQVTWAGETPTEPGASGGPKKVEIHVHPQSREKLGAAAAALVAALRDSGVAAADLGFSCGSMNADAIHIRIGG